MEKVSSASPLFEVGGRFSFCIRPFFIPVNIESVIEEVVPRKKITWRVEKFGIIAMHEYIFRETDSGVSVKSRETFSGFLFALYGISFFRERLKQLTLTLLEELKGAAENRKDNGPKD